MVSAKIKCPVSGLFISTPHGDAFRECIVLDPCNEHWRSLCFKGSDGYAIVKLHGKYRRLHRILLNAPNHLEVDHINGNRIDNRLSNLRLVTHQDNGRNLKLRKDNTSGRVGVCKGKRNLWQAYYRCPNGKQLNKQNLEFSQAVQQRELWESIYGKTTR